MTQTQSTVNTIAPLANVSICAAAMERAINRPAHLPGLVCYYGPSGWGKSFSASYVANTYRAYYVEAKSSWTRKAIITAMLREMGVEPAKTIYEMTDQVAEHLVISGRPMIVDEMDHIVEKKAVEVIRDIYEGSNAPMLLIGEERLPAKLKAWERFHGRMLDWVPAQPADADDAQTLARLYCPGLAIDDGLLHRISEISRGSVRRICVNVERVREEALQLGVTAIGLDDWGNRRLFDGDAPARRY